MEWIKEADEALRKVPFFVRKRVRSRVEKEAQQAGKTVVALADVKASQARYLASMASEIKGYQLETCFGTSGCPNRAIGSDDLLEKLETLLKAEDLLAFLKKQVGEDLKFHHEFRITLADCPNACSQPQIKDIGIIGACSPRVTAEPCTLCEACVQVCKEEAITLNTDSACPEIDGSRCSDCGQCIRTCPNGAMAEGQKGFRIQLGGKLGRHPQLAIELPGIYSAEKVLAIVKDCIRFYKHTSRRGERFGQILQPADIDEFVKRYA